MGKPVFPVFDCDSHVYEPSAIWERYLAPEYRILARSVFWHGIDENGLVSIILNGESALPMNHSKLVRQAVWRPGMTLDYIGNLDASRFHELNPGASDPEARLRDMDQMGIEGALIFPTLFAEYFPVAVNPDVASALARAYNDWIHDFCETSPRRLFAAAVLPMQDVTFAIAEARRSVKRGFKAVLIRPVHTNGRFLNYSYFDPLWRELETLGLAAFIHPSPGMTNPEWTCTGPFVDRVADVLQVGHSISEAAAPMMDNGTALNALFYSRHFEDYPKLKLAFAHAGATLLVLALEKIESFTTISSNIRDLTLEPEDVFAERPSLVTFDGWESAVPRLHAFYGGIAAWGSRYPQHDTALPQEALENLKRESVPMNVVRALMGGNAMRFLGVN